MTMTATASITAAMAKVILRPIPIAQDSVIFLSLLSAVVVEAAIVVVVVEGGTVHKKCIHGIRSVLSTLFELILLVCSSGKHAYSKHSNT